MAVSSFVGLAEQLDAWEREQDLSGSFLLTLGGETVFEQTVGYAERATSSPVTPVTPATRFATASLTKMFTAVAVVDLVNAGSLSFDSRVVDLLSHTSGIADHCEEKEEAPNYLEDYASLWVARPGPSRRSRAAPTPTSCRSVSSHAQAWARAGCSRPTSRCPTWLSAICRASDPMPRGDRTSSVCP